MKVQYNPFQAASALSERWMDGEHAEDLPRDCRPADRAQGYAVQALLPELVGSISGWKIAATSLAGQRHIRVNGPLVGPIFAHRIFQDGATVSLAANHMRVAECEIVFRFGRALGPRPHGWNLDEILETLASVSPGIELPDSRFLDFESAGEAQLIADCACSNDMVMGHAQIPDSRLNSLASLQVQALMSDGRRMTGTGSNVLGDPLVALHWFVNEITGAGQTVEMGQFVTTGACVAPIPVLPGQQLEAEFGWLGRMTVSFS